MNLPKSLTTQFAKSAVNNKKNEEKETFIQGNIVRNDKGQLCVKLFESSDIYIPVKITTNINVNQPVTVMIKNHTASVIGNVTEIVDETDSEILNNTASLEVDAIPTAYIEALWNNADYDGDYEILMNGLPIEISTAEEMDALLIEANIGKIYKYVGETTEKYIKDNIYIVTEE